MKTKINLPALLIVLCTSLLFAQQNVTIRDVTKSPQSYEDEDIALEGFVEQFIPESSKSRAHYILKGRYGGMIRVNTNLQKAPEQNKKYHVEGLLLIKNGDPYIVAQNEYLINTNKKETTTPVVSPRDDEREVETTEDNTTLYIIVGAGVLLIIIVIVLIVQRKGGAAEEEYSTDAGDQDFSAAAFEEQDFKTVRMNLNDDSGTIRYMPGKFVLSEGLDKGKVFRISGKSGPNGRVATIGRENIGNNNFHIKLEDQTVSRKQAEIREENGKLFLKNLSSTNPTALNGRDLGVGEEVALGAGAKLKMGEIQMEYLL